MIPSGTVPPSTTADFIFVDISLSLRQVQTNNPSILPEGMPLKIGSLVRKSAH
jgi:hypothetical protein